MKVETSGFNTKRQGHMQVPLPPLVFKVATAKIYSMLFNIPVMKKTIKVKIPYLKNMSSNFKPLSGLVINIVDRHYVLLIMMVPVAAILVAKNLSSPLLQK